MDRLFKLILARDQRGQASLMIGMMMLTFILFFLFVINTGMLVNAKINLQNAADLAAYAGAATQARQLNQISYLNYEMRRQYKKFLFRYYVMGNMAQGSQPTSATNTPRIWKPNAPSVLQNNPDFQVPAVCVVFKQGDNYCQLANLPAIVIPPNTFADPITSALNRQLQAIERIRRGNCDRIAGSNLNLLELWLFNTDPELKNLVDPTINQNPDSVALLDKIRGLAQGLGVMPREFILLQRIKTLAKFVNAPAITGLDSSKGAQLATAADNMPTERAVQAFFSAYYTLGNNSFDASSIRMDEILPGDSDQARLIKLDPMMTAFDSYAVIWEDAASASGGVTLPNGQSGACLAKLAPVTVSALPVGVVKDPKVLTYYAVRLKAKAHVLFSPFGDVELKAYAAAQPFGSRIGPPLSIMSKGFFHQGEAPTNLLPGNAGVQQTVANGLIHQVPNLPVQDTDPPAPQKGSGWDNNLVIFNMFQKFAPPGQGVGPVIGPNDLERGYQAAMVPNPGEAPVYNILTDLGDDPFVRNFDTLHNASYWAPIFTQQQANQGKDAIRQAIDDAFQPGNLNLGQFAARNGGAALRDLTVIKQVVLDGISQYLTALGQGGGEDGEGINVVRLRDAFTSRPDGVNPPQNIVFGADDAKIRIQTATQAKTSWNQVNDGSYRDRGRVGYSVKFVSFDSLTKNKTSTDGSTTWTNELPLEGESQADVQAIKH